MDWVFSPWSESDGLSVQSMVWEWWISVESLILEWWIECLVLGLRVMDWVFSPSEEMVNHIPCAVQLWMLKIPYRWRTFVSVSRIKLLWKQNMCVCVWCKSTMKVERNLYMSVSKVKVPNKNQTTWKVSETLISRCTDWDCTTGISLCLFLSLWPFQLYFIPWILPTTHSFSHSVLPVLSLP